MLYFKFTNELNIWTFSCICLRGQFEGSYKEFLLYKICLSWMQIWSGCVLFEIFGPYPAFIREIIDHRYTAIRTFQSVIHDSHKWSSATVGLKCEVQLLAEVTIIIQFSSNLAWMITFWSSVILPNLVWISSAVSTPGDGYIHIHGSMTF